MLHVTLPEIIDQTAVKITTVIQGFLYWGKCGRAYVAQYC